MNTKSYFAKTADLVSTITKIREIEASNPTMPKFTHKPIPRGEYASKKEMQLALAHLAAITRKAPAKASSARPAPITAKPLTSSAKASGRTAAEIMALSPTELGKLRNSATVRGSAAALEIKAAHKNCLDSKIRFQLYKAFESTLLNH